MSNNTQLTTTEEQNNPAHQPVVSGPNEGEVKDINAVGDDHPLVAETGDAALETQTESGAGEFLSDFIYEHDSAWVREWLQNEETACYRAAKLLVQMSDEYSDDWLTVTKWVDADTSETVVDHDESQSILADYDCDIADLRQIELPRSMEDVLEAARSLGYDPTIVWDVYRDERKIITEDNGIGMTPYEFDKAFNTIFNSGAGVDGESGGQFGVGSESSALVHGNDGGAEVTTRSRRPTKDGEEYDGFRAYSYLGGANALPGEVEEDFKGTRFDIPVQEDFDLSNLQGWVEEYTEMLRVPLLYREHDAGTTPVEEEYEATEFSKKYDDAPVIIEKTGEFSVAAGPEVQPSTRYSEPDPPDTFLVSMPIDRNTRASISTFWDVVIQIHDEQGLIVAGPHRGQYEDDVDDLHEDDVVLPEPTGDRDRLQRDSMSKEFFYHVQDVVKSEELKQISDIAQQMQDADHPADVIRGEPENWTIFKKMVRYHGSRRATEDQQKFKKFVNDRDEFPDYDPETMNQVYGLFKKVSHCHHGSGRSSRKSDRSEKSLGDILSENDPETIYMAASTGGKFTQRFKVIEATHDDPEVIVISGAQKYETWSNQFGFRVLKKVPLTQPTDEEPHDYEVSDYIHENNTNTGSSNCGKADKVVDRALKIRTSGDNSSIDLRLSIKNAQEWLEKGGRFNDKDKLVLFPRTEDENISDHYDLADYAAIASVSKAEYDALADYDEVMTYEEYTEWSKSALIATEEGAKTPTALIADDRMVVLAYRPPDDHDVVKLLGDDYAHLRNYYVEDIRDQYSWASALKGFDGGFRGDDVEMVPDVAKDDTLFAVADPIVLGRAEWTFHNLWSQEVYSERCMTGLKLTNGKFGYGNLCEWKNLKRSTTRYRLMADTPNWDDSSDVYDLMPNDRGSKVSQIYLGFHDRNIDPSEVSNDKLREIISQ
jgi:hypothetical protein